MEKKVARRSIQKNVSYGLEKRVRAGHLSEIAVKSVGANRKNESAGRHR